MAASKRPDHMRGDDDLARSASRPLFVYGSLRQGERGAHLLDADAIRRVPAAVRGRMVETGASYPGAVFDGADGLVHGELVWLRPATYAATLGRLDAYEDVPTLFRRVLVVAEVDGERVEASAYEWQGPCASVQR